MMATAIDGHRRSRGGAAAPPQRFDVRNPGLNIEHPVGSGRSRRRALISSPCEQQLQSLEGSPDFLSAFHWTTTLRAEILL